ncbi:MAG TPA: DUF4233 domain-containing protein [Mycobacteriales bacterium]|nr:DUF4233 domain-containing protein [Mycobacteriales bacterium]
MNEPVNPRAAKAVRAVFAGTLCLEAITVLFVPRAVSQFGDGLTTAKLTYALALAGLLIVTAGLLRRPWGLGLGTVLQLGIIACGIMTTAMYVLGVIFTAIWVYGLRVRGQVLRHYAAMDAANQPAGKQAENGE